MFQFIGMIWNEADVNQQAAVQGLIHALLRETSWRTALDVPGMKVLCVHERRGASEAYVLTGDAGVVLGTVFNPVQGEQASTRAQFTATESRKVLDSSGRYLSEAYWGRYVAFLHDRARRKKIVLRSPTGELDCLTSEYHGARLYFSSLTSNILRERLRLSVNWDYMAATTCSILPEARSTGLREITRLVHGECVSVTAEGIVRGFHWHPADVVRSNSVMEDAEAAKVALRETTKACIRSWASCYPSILEMLSGGLDSSIILGCLKEERSARKITCLNVRNRNDVAADERRYAQLAAQSAKVALIESQHDDTFPIEAALNGHNGSVPLSNRIFAFGHVATITKVARQVEASACFTGEGGDQVFYQNGERYAWADYVRRFGLRPSALRLLLDAARVEADTVWGVVKKGMFTSQAELPRPNPGFDPLVKPEIFKFAEQTRLFLHPWLQSGAEEISRGKWWHILLLTSSMDETMHDPWASAGDAENVAPLISQPVVELCLRIPTYLFFTGGRDRELARHAFSAEVPRRILLRTEKGFTYDSTKDVVARNLGFIREVLLDGILVKERILDRLKLEQVLSGSVTDEVGHAPLILKHVAFEWWVQNWQCRERKAAA